MLHESADLFLDCIKTLSLFVFDRCECLLLFLVIGISILCKLLTCSWIVFRDFCCLSWTGVSVCRYLLVLAFMQTSWLCCTTYFIFLYTASVHLFRLVLPDTQFNISCLFFSFSLLLCFSSRYSPKLSQQP